MLFFNKCKFIFLQICKSSRLYLKLTIGQRFIKAKWGWNLIIWMLIIGYVRFDKMNLLPYSCEIHNLNVQLNCYNALFFNLVFQLDSPTLGLLSILFSKFFLTKNIDSWLTFQTLFDWCKSILIVQLTV